MSHPYKAFMADKHDNNIINNLPSQTNIHLSPLEEHYLKKTLIKNQIISELNSLSPEYNDTSGLRRFGPPFVPADPQLLLKNPDSGTLDQIVSISQASIDIFKSQFPLLRFIFDNYFVTFPFIKIHINKLGPSMKDQSKFWLKIQVLFELFKSKKISNSNDRGSTSKRKLIMYKFQSLFLMLFNSSIYCKQDHEYFELDKEKRGAYKKLGKFIDQAEAQNIDDNEKNEEIIKHKIENDKKNILNMNLSPERLLAYLDNIDNDEFINGYYLNVVGVSIETETSTSFWGSKESKYYAFIIHVKKPQQQGYFIKKRYSDFSTLYKQLKESYPGCHLPELPSKDKHEVEMNLNNDESCNSKKSDIDYNKIDEFDSNLTDMDKESLDALFAMNSPSISTSSEFVQDESENSSQHNSSSGLLKTPKLGGFLKSPLSASSRKFTASSPTLGKNMGKLEKSFLSSFKKTTGLGSSSSSVDINSDLSLTASHKRTESQTSVLSENSIDSINSSDTSETFHSAQEANVDSVTGKIATISVKDNKITFPREILRQSLRGFLKYLLYIKPIVKSHEFELFLGKDNTKPIILNKKEIEDIQHRVNIDHLRTLQHYKFQSALVGIVKILEKDIENLKTEIYNEGFGYVFERIKKYKTLHELCGYDSENLNNSTWLKNANMIGAEEINFEEVESNDSKNIGSASDESAPLRGLIRIILLEIASTQYELLVGSDSALGTLKTIKRLHAVFPYRLVAGVLRFTNPLMMVKRMIDVFTYQMPNVSGTMSGSVNAIGSGIGGMMQGLGFSKRKPEDSTNSANANNKPVNSGGKSLLQLIFSGMLGEDLRKLEKELIEVKDLLISHNNEDGYGEGEIIIERIDSYFKADDDIVLHIKDMSKKLDLDIPITILMPNNGLKNCEELGTQTIKNILKDYAHIKQVEIEKNKTDLENDENGENSEKLINKSKELDSPYRLSKRYFYLQLRKFDKESLVELWNEPELMNVIKEVFSLFLSPLIDLFKKAEVYKYVPILAKYIGELIELCENYNNDYGEFGRSDIVGSLVGLGEKYSEDVYRFIRDMYLNDIKSNGEDGKLFEGIVEWLNRIISFLRFVKNERPDLMIDLNKMIHDMKLNSEDKIKILKSINLVVKKAERKKQVLEKMENTGELKKKNEEEEREHDWMKMSRDRKVDSNWDAIHSRVFKVGETISGNGGDVLDMVGIEGIEDGEDIETDSETEEIQQVDGKAIRMKKLKDCNWEVDEFVENYYSRDWSGITTKQSGNKFGKEVEGSEFWNSPSGEQVRKQFSVEVEKVFAEYAKRK